MASLYGRQKYVIERHGVLQAVHSWRSKLINCVGLENILTWFASRLAEDLKLFKDCHPAGVSDWSFDENCLFCCLRRETVKEHLVGLNNQIFGSASKALPTKNQSIINRLEWQTEEFLNAVLCRKDTPRFTDSHIPSVACEIMQRMVHQFVAEYTSKTSSSQDHPHPSIIKDQSQCKPHSVASPPAAMASAAPSTQSPVLSKLLMAEQDSPLDLTVKKAEGEFCEQDGVLDLSMKNNRNRESTSFRSPLVGPIMSVIKGDTRCSSFSRARDLQSASSLEQVMTKLCLHHQRQIVDALGFLQTEVKSVASPNSSKLSTETPVLQQVATTSCCPVPFKESLDIHGLEKKLAPSSTPRRTSEIQESATIKNSKLVAVEQITNTDGSEMVSDSAGPALELFKTGITDGKIMSSPLSCSDDGETASPKLLAPLRVKMKHSDLDTTNLSCMVSRSQQPSDGTLEKRPCNPETFSQESSVEPEAETSSSFERHDLSEPQCITGPRISIGHTKDTTVRLVSIQRTSAQISPISPRTARKSRKGPHSRLRDGSRCQLINDADSQFDIVYIAKPITDCEVQRQNRMLPRRNARKSTRGHKCFEEYWELKTVRTLARKSVDDGRSNCPVPMPDIVTLITPKQALAKPDGVPPVDMPFAGGCIETVMEKASDQPMEREIPGDVVADIGDKDLVVETTQTGQTQNVDHVSPSLPSSPSSNQRSHDSESEGLPVKDQDHRNTELPNLDDLNITTDRSEEQMEPSNSLSTDVPSSKVMLDEPLSVVESEGEVVTEECLPTLDSLNPTQKDLGNMEDRVSREVDQSSPKTDAQEPCQKVPADQEELTELQKTHEQDTNLELNDGEKLTEEKMVIADVPIESVAVETVAESLERNEKLEKSEQNIPECIGPKKGVARYVETSDRCLRSKASTGCADATKLTEKNIVNTPENKQTSGPQINLKSEPKRSLRSCKLKQDEDVSSLSDDQHVIHNSSERNLEKEQKLPAEVGEGTALDRMQTRQKHKTATKAAEVDKQQHVPDEQKACKSKEHEHLSATESVPLENVDVTNSKDLETAVDHNGSSAGQTADSSECVPLRSKSSPMELSSSMDPCVSSVGISPVSSERMPLRRRNGSVVADSEGGDNSSPAIVSSPDSSGHMPLRSRSNHAAASPMRGGLSRSPKGNASESPGRMPLRSRTSGVSALPIVGETPSTSVTPATESPGRRPLRSGNHTVEQATSKDVLNASAVSTSESSGRMPLRSGDSVAVEQQDASPMKNKKSQRLSKTAEPSPVKDGAQILSHRTKSKAERNSTQAKLELPTNLLNSAGLPKVEPVTPKFLEALKREEHQQLISNLNTKFDKMQKGWVQMDKEGQPAPRPKNKADRLKEIWKSKRRIRKPRPADQQKFSPVQMLFMKSFDLPSICRWFLQSTETKSLVIVKKMNTRLPSETQLCFHTSASMPGSSHGVFPSVQAERLKKHLKKFAMASPVKSNPKNKKLIAKALAQDMSVIKGKEKRELTTATRITTKPHSYTGVTQSLISEGQKAVVNTKNPASARILRKYSNMREKMQVQHNTQRCKENSENLKTAKVKPPILPNTASKQKYSVVHGQTSSSAVKNERLKAGSGKNSTKSTNKEKVPKSGVNRTLRNLSEKNGTSPRMPSQSQATSKLRKVPPTSANTKSPVNRKEGTMNAEAEKPSDEKVDAKKSLPNKSNECLVSEPQDLNMKQLSSPDQVLTRSQRKIEATILQTVSPKSTSKRTLDPVVTPVKRTRTSLSK